MINRGASGDGFRNICKSNNWKCTAQRRAVYSYLEGNREHPSVETVWKNVRAVLPDVSLDSIYRILNEFADNGLLRRLDGCAVFRYDPDTSDHDHFVCSRCGRIYDFTFLDAAALVERCRPIGEVESAELQVKGICDACRSGE